MPNANKKPPGNIRFNKESPTELPKEKRFEDKVSTTDPKYVMSQDGSENPFPKETSSVPIQKKKTLPKTKSAPPSVPSLETKPTKYSKQTILDLHVSTSNENNKKWEHIEVEAEKRKIEIEPTQNEPSMKTERKSGAKKAPPSVPSLETKPRKDSKQVDIDLDEKVNDTTYETYESDETCESYDDKDNVTGEKEKRSDLHISTSIEKKAPPAVPSEKTKPTKDLEPVGFDLDVKEKSVNETLREKGYKCEEKKGEISSGVKKKPVVPPRTAKSNLPSKPEPSVVSQGLEKLGDFEENKPQLKGNRRTDLPPVPRKSSKPALIFVEQNSNVETQPEKTINTEGGTGSREMTLQRTKTIINKFKKTNTTRLAEVQESYDNDACQKDVDADVNEKSKRARHAFKAAEEIMTSEKTYVDVLKILDKFCKGVKEAFPDIYNQGRTTFFSVVPTLLTLNSHLLEEFEDRIENWESRKKIADVLVAKANFLKIYSEYIKNLQHSRKLIEESIQKFPPFAKFLAEFEKHPVCQGLGVGSHMIGPIQRVPRYELLLKTYLKNQEEDSEDFEDSQKALKIVLSVADAIDHSIPAQERRMAMHRLGYKDARELKSHPWFQEFGKHGWNALERKLIRPPYVPTDVNPEKIPTKEPKEGELEPPADVHDYEIDSIFADFTATDLTGSP